jgi:hypothetical protein
MSRKKTVAAIVNEFAAVARSGTKARVVLAKRHAQSFLEMLAREGFAFARDALKQISDPDLRRMVETIFFSGIAGASAGATIGFLVGGPAGAQVGAGIGLATGVVAAAISLTIHAHQQGEKLVLEVN